MSAPAVNLDPGRINDTVRAAIKRRLEMTGKVNANINLVAGGSRGGVTNKMIADVQAEHGRNPWYLPDDTREAVSILVRRMAVDLDIIDGQLRRIGRLIKDGVLENVARQANKGGKPFRELTENYAAYKRRKFGFTVPILKATGDLLGGVRVVIERLGRA